MNLGLVFGRLCEYNGYAAQNCNMITNKGLFVVAFYNPDMLHILMTSHLLELISHRNDTIIYNYFNSSEHMTGQFDRREMIIRNKHCQLQISIN